MLYPFTPYDWPRCLSNECAMRLRLHDACTSSFVCVLSVFRDQLYICSSSVGNSFRFRALWSFCACRSLSVFCLRQLGPSVLLVVSAAAP
jgi:hypothetical protein